MRPILLDERLSLAIELFPTCEIGADIGTDHGLFPCRLLEEGRCQRMILSDISEKALAHAQALVERRGLQDKAALVIANGLDCLTEPVDCVSIMGMGGRTIAEILHAGQARLHTVVRLMGPENQIIRRMGVSSGAGGDGWVDAKALGAEAFLSGEIKHHEALGCVAAGMVALEAGHYATEAPGIFALADALQTHLNAVQCNVCVSKSLIPGYLG